MELRARARVKVEANPCLCSMAVNVCVHSFQQWQPLPSGVQCWSKTGWNKCLVQVGGCILGWSWKAGYSLKQLSVCCLCTLTGSSQVYVHSPRLKSHFLTALQEAPAEEGACIGRKKKPRRNIGSKE